ncbi:hypothetical protein [Allopontixanthobacter sediminis]|uniref:Uncharacterized protein n=1 Tax=Allopontixanthobacter sediminis TaxID=1689985 RepID=A0A845AZC8_9SPHN|nr:hypothetical protein [Allopontixanthobacter sediminis]MXP44381.1 hypothetical protein [Allopontixanthobacter sediminis]
MRETLAEIPHCRESSGKLGPCDQPQGCPLGIVGPRLAKGKLTVGRFVHDNALTSAMVKIG